MVEDEMRGVLVEIGTEAVGRDDSGRSPASATPTSEAVALPLSRIHPHKIEFKRCEPGRPRCARSCFARHCVRLCFDIVDLFI